MSSPRRSTRAKLNNGLATRNAKSQGKQTTQQNSRNRLTSKHSDRGKESNTTSDIDVLGKDEAEISEQESVNEEYLVEESDESLDSDAIDDEDFDVNPKVKSPKKTQQKRKRISLSTATPSIASNLSPRKRRKSAKEDSEESFDESLEVVGEIVQAPTSGRVPPGQISRNTLTFLRELKDPEKNDREWFKLHEPVYRQAEQEWKDFIEQFTKVLVDVDPQIPILPPKDVIHRIYRDVRFSNDKTPYKTGFSASFSRGGKKSIFAGYHLCVKPGESFLAAGSWQPGRYELQTIRNNLLRSSSRFRDLISSQEFEKLFGEAKPKPQPKGKKVNPSGTDSYSQRRNVFGREDELKVAPKGVNKDHKDIDILKLRSFAVSVRFDDEEVLIKDFKEKLREILKVVRPFVRCLNDLMTVPELDDESGNDQE